ncbi:hypothetical protein M409DRAFT_19308 [Zasmidium cellare ATCC 36951]|uniref:Uncharacterized protein n=1 Tax=Zasmidium cellare ATCC 36951 TaxID=1080233 RepID=A0A6A6CTA4_ZASCE|nr:uncharacterized protein M409DRAFT_19308 [Zasmidium cellare ATCC 36951]KAF2170487.1 hypothetical protein M409DRAFT_19308 [Zasmidium cellare ATCC 36951]
MVLPAFFGPRQNAAEHSSSITDVEDDVQTHEIRPVYLTDHQRKLLKFYQSGDIVGLLKAIGKAEKRSAMSEKSSRLLNTNLWPTVATYLLMQPAQPPLESLLDMTLPQRSVKARGDQLHHTNRTPAGCLRRPGRPDQWKGKKDPVVYVQSLADRDGCGLTCDEFERFLDAMIVGAKIKEDENGNFVVRNRSLVLGVVQGHYRYQNKHFYESLGKNTDNSLQILQERVSEFVKVNRQILADAREQELDHIMPKFEVGWSGKGYQRCEDHRKLIPLGGSPNLMRLAILVLQHLHHDRDFQYHQFVLFDVIRDVQAEVGESLASQLCCSYETYGGFNAAQAGASVLSAKEMEYRDWAEVERDTTRQNFLGNVKENLRRMEELYEEELSRDAEYHKRQKVESRLRDGAKEQEYLDVQLKAGMSEMESATASLDDRISRLRRAMEARQQREHDREEWEQALMEVAEALEED